MFGIGFTELLVIAVVALIFIGPDKLPDLARTVGKTFLDLKRAADDIKTQVTEIEPGRSRAPGEPRTAPEGPVPEPAPEAPDTKPGWADTRADTEAEAEAAAPEAAEAEKPGDKQKTARKPRKKTGKTA